MANPSHSHKNAGFLGEFNSNHEDRPSEQHAHHLKNARIIWDYLRLKQKPHHAKFLVALGNSYMEDVAKRTADLYFNGMARMIITSGGVTRKAVINGKTYEETEAALLKRYLKLHGVPDHAIITETQSTNTGENFSYTQKLLEKMGYKPQRKKPSLLVVTAPFVERRAMATAAKQTPLLDVRLTSFESPFDDFMATKTPQEQRIMLHILAGTMNRIYDYAKMGLQTPQEVPLHVARAHQELIKDGFKGDYIRHSEYCPSCDRKRRPKATCTPA